MATEAELAEAEARLRLVLTADVSQVRQASDTWRVLGNKLAAIADVLVGDVPGVIQTSWHGAAADAALAAFGDLATYVDESSALMAQTSTQLGIAASALEQAQQDIEDLPPVPERPDLGDAVITAAGTAAATTVLGGGPVSGSGIVAGTVSVITSAINYDQQVDDYNNALAARKAAVDTAYTALETQLQDVARNIPQAPATGGVDRSGSETDGAGTGGSGSDGGGSTGGGVTGGTSGQTSGTGSSVPWTTGTQVPSTSSLAPGTTGATPGSTTGYVPGSTTGPTTTGYVPGATPGYVPGAGGFVADSADVTGTSGYGGTGTGGTGTTGGSWSTGGISSGIGAAAGGAVGITGGAAVSRTIGSVTGTTGTGATGTGTSRIGSTTGTGSTRIGGTTGTTGSALGTIGATGTGARSSGLVGGAGPAGAAGAGGRGGATRSGSSALTGRHLPGSTTGARTSSDPAAARGAAAGSRTGMTTGPTSGTGRDRRSKKPGTDALTTEEDWLDDDETGPAVIR